MKSITSLKRLGPIIGIVFLGIFVWALKAPETVTVVPATDKPSGVVTQGESMHSISSPQLGSMELSTRLKIPSINIDAGIEPVGLTADGKMDAPAGPYNVGWYKLGPKPGESGSAVIDGHSGRWQGVLAVFDKLGQLQIGDKLYFEDEKGVTITFVVRETRIYDPVADASEVFSSSDGKAHLNLITCEGVWNPIKKSYSERLVVFTDREG